LRPVLEELYSMEIVYDYQKIVRDNEF